MSRPGVCHSPAVRDEPGGSGVVWRGRKRDRDRKGQAAMGALLGWWPHCGDSKSAAEGVRGTLLLEVFVGSVWLSATPPLLFLSKILGM